MDTSKLIKIRDELDFKKGIFNGKLKKKWHKLERDFQVIQSEVLKILPDAKAAFETTMPLLQRVNVSFRKIQDAVGRNHRSSRGTGRSHSSVRSMRSHSKGRKPGSSRSTSYGEMRKAS